MNEISCGIVRDLLPLYHDGVCSPESRDAVDAHIKSCPACEAELEKLSAELSVPHAAADEKNGVKALSKAWKKGKRRALLLGADAVIMALLALIVGFNIFFAVGRVEGPGMLPTLAHGQVCLFSRTAQPARWRVVYVKTGIGHGIRDIARVVGMPGDAVEIRNGTLYINGAAYDDDTHPAGRMLPGDMTGPVTVPEDYYFVLGDNQAKALDSRYDRYGLIAAPDVIGVYLGSESVPAQSVN